MAMFKRGILQERIPHCFSISTQVFWRCSESGSPYKPTSRNSHAQKSLVAMVANPTLRQPLGISPYYHANGSAIGFFPEDYHWLFERFNEEVIGQPMETLPKTLRVDDRFTSYHCRRTLRVFPSRLITKYSDEYMSPSLRWSDYEILCRGVKRRRKNLVAISFLVWISSQMIWSSYPSGRLSSISVCKESGGLGRFETIGCHRMMQPRER